jgi:hypothetical protein
MKHELSEFLIKILILQYVDMKFLLFDKKILIEI